MKGLLLLAKPKGESPMMGKMMGKSEPESKAEDSDEGGSEMEFARIASEAIAEGDHEAAAKALVGAIRACMSAKDAGSYDEE